jgi:hypothetical protein
LMEIAVGIVSYIRKLVYTNSQEENTTNARGCQAGSNIRG